MVVMTVTGINVVMKNNSNGSNGSDHEVTNLKMDHGIMKQCVLIVNCSNLVVMT